MSDDLGEVFATVYVATVADRHTDPEVRVFASPESAIGWARSAFTETVAHPEEITEDPPEHLADGELLRLGYIEEDYASVIETELVT